MSQLTSISSRASEGSLLPRDGQDSEQSPSAKSIPTARKCSQKTFWPTPVVGTAAGGQSTGGLRVSVLGSMQTSSTSTEQPTEVHRSSQVDFLASHSALPGSAEARRMTVISGRRCCALLRKQDPLSCLAKTFLESSRWNSTTCFLTWKASATPQGRLLFRLVPSMPDTDETGFGYLVPTPSATPENSQNNANTNGPATLRDVMYTDWLPGGRVDRLKGLGNAIVPQVAFEILHEIRKLI
jgi:hypothetical protein